MLWTNLIMDILGAIAIGTEPYKKTSTEKSNRISRRDKIILAEVWRQVLVQAVYQIMVIVLLMYFGQFIFFEKSFSLFDPIRDEDGNATPRLVLDTICFHTFILMNLFNQINCRVVDANEMNVFLTLFNNPTFWFIMAFEFFIQ